MGITGLLPMLRSITDNIHIRELSGLTVGIDSLCWIHRGVYACAAELSLALENNPDSHTTGPLADAVVRGMRKYVKFCEDRLDMLLAHGIRPYFVFDGGALPAKKATETTRKTSRQTALAAAKATKDAAKAQNLYARAIDVSPQLAYEFLRVLKRRNLPFVVAPYEADAQLAFLSHKKIVDAVITEDSDMLPYGVSRVVLKLAANGTSQHISRHRFSECTEMSLHSFTDDMFLNMCVLAGCDYMPSIEGMAIKRAHAAVKKAKTVQSLLTILRFEHSNKLPEAFEAQFTQAKMTFLHQRVFDPVARKMVTLTPLPSDVSDPKSFDFLGPLLSDEIASGIADGIIDPSTMAPYLDMPLLYEVKPAYGAGDAGRQQKKAPEVLALPSRPRQFGIGAQVSVTPITKFFGKGAAAQTPASAVLQESPANVVATVRKDVLHIVEDDSPALPVRDGSRFFPTATPLPSPVEENHLDTACRERKLTAETPLLDLTAFKRDADKEYTTPSGAQVLQIASAHQTPYHAEPFALQYQPRPLSSSSKSKLSLVSSGPGKGVLRQNGVVSPNMTTLPRRVAQAPSLQLDFEQFRYAVPQRNEAATVIGGAAVQAKPLSGSKRARSNFAPLCMIPLQQTTNASTAPSRSGALAIEAEDEQVPSSPTFDDEDTSPQFGHAPEVSASKPWSSEGGRSEHIADQRDLKPWSPQGAGAVSRPASGRFIPSASGISALKVGASAAAQVRLGLHTDVVLTPD